MNLDKVKISIEELKDIQTEANIARSAILKMTTLAKSGHPGGSMSTIDFLLTLYHMIDVDPANPCWEKRDRVVIQALFHTGVRVTELASIVIGQIDLNASVSG